MATMKTTLITTVYNESTSIEKFLKSVLNQTQLPNEVIIVDAESTDKTQEKIRAFFSKYKRLHGKLIVKKGNRSVGRNEAVKKAKNSIILCSDAGCLLDKSWVREISRPFAKKSISVVSGFYKPVTKNIFQKALAAYTSTMPDKLNPPTFLPSSRSIAFRKTAWKKAGGYPENLDTCEDLIFDEKLQKTKAKFYFQQSALVYWPQRKNLWQAAKQFFSYAKGDGKAHFFRKSTPFLFLRYIIGFFLTFAAFSYHIVKLEELVGSLFILYFFWAIAKNYRYVNHALAIFLLPLLQLTSDIAVLVGTTLGFLQSVEIKRFVKQNFWSILIILGYMLVVLTGIEWGIPNNNHPFNYHMDEWAQAQSIRDIFRHGTPNINGASHGAIFFYFLGGIYLIPFILLHILNPFIIKNSLQHIAEQHRMFELLRINTLLWGIGSISFIIYIAKKYLKTNPFISGLLFALTPVFLILSGYYKYDIGLVFWIILSLFFTFRYSDKPTLKNFLILGFVNALTLAVKVSAIPILGTFVVAFFLFTPKWRKKLLYIPAGIAVFGLTFALFGVPDLLLGIGDYGEWFHANLVSGPNETVNYNIHENYLLYLFGTMYPANFGKAFFPVYVLSITYAVTSVINGLFKKLKQNKYILFLLISLIFFFASLVPLKLAGTRNRLLVLLPFLILLTSYTISQIKVKFVAKLLLQTILICVFLLQTAESLSWVSTRIFPDPQSAASEWILKNIPTGETIGLTDVPIFENLPDILLKEYYTQIYRLPEKTKYSYTIINKQTKKFPKYIVITNAITALDIFKQSEKKDIIVNLTKNNYKLSQQFTPNMTFLHYFYTLDDFYLGNISSPTDISIYTAN